MSVRLLTYIAIAAILATGGVALVLHRLAVTEHRVCESSLKVRTPFETFIASELRLVKTANTLQIAEAKLTPPPPPALAQLQQKLSQVQAQNRQNLASLDAALRHAVTTGCNA